MKPRCPDCSASLESPAWHEPTCPLALAVERVVADDAAWFAAHPREDSRIRRVTFAERLEMRAMMEFDPPPALVVKQMAPGVRTRFFGRGFQVIDGGAR